MYAGFDPLGRQCNVSIVVITPPAALPVDAETARRHLGVDERDIKSEDLDRLVAAATGEIDGPGGWLGRAIISQTLEVRCDGFFDDIELPYPPLIQVVSVKYDDATGTEQTVDPAAYRLIGGETKTLTRVQSATWPSVSGERECVRIRYTCGYGDKPGNVPAQVRQAILMMVQEAYSLGERNLFVSSETTVGVSTTQYIVSDNASAALRGACDKLLAPLRVFSA